MIRKKVHQSSLLPFKKKKEGLSSSSLTPPLFQYPTKQIKRLAFQGFYIADHCINREEKLKTIYYD
jgi:hypothetical protein